jgi:hypothetical protein
MNKYKYIIITSLLLTILIVLSFYKNYNEPFAELGLADENEEYIYPKVYTDFISKKEAEYIKKILQINLTKAKFWEAMVKRMRL